MCTTKIHQLVTKAQFYNKTQSTKLPKPHQMFKLAQMCHSLFQLQVWRAAIQNHPWGASPRNDW